MLRKALTKRVGLNEHFRYRGEDHSRIETFSDAVFALAVTLLVLSSSVPQTFSELNAAFSDLLPFAICIILLILIWHEHYIFFIRYGLKDSATVALNTLLLFLVLFYVYPLKFLMKVLFQLFSGIFTGDKLMLDYLFAHVIKLEDTPTLMLIYGFGAMAIFLTLAAMYSYANKRKEELELNEIEKYDTKTNIWSNLAMAIPPFISLSISAIGFGDARTTFMMAGMSYWTYPIIMISFHYFRNKKRTKRYLLNNLSQNNE